VHARDLYFNGRRLIPARYPNVPPVCWPEKWEDPNDPPCSDDGVLVVTFVDRIPASGGNPRLQRVSVRRAGGAAWPSNIDWDEVEVVSRRNWAAPRQFVT